MDFERQRQQTRQDPAFAAPQHTEPQQQFITGFETGTKYDAPEKSGAPVGPEQLREFNLTLNKYKAGKAHLERRVVAAEKWWKLRNEFEERKTDAEKLGMSSTSAWMHNVINSKHADYLEAYPEPNILPREEGDKLEAWALSKIIPVVLKHNGFMATYDHNGWQKLKTGTGVYKVFWDRDKLNGLGDVSITRRDLLNIYWEPGITDIQDSKMVFDVEMMDKDVLVETYPDLLTDKMLASAVMPTKFPTDDHVPLDDKVAVIDVYYKKKGTLHYCKYVGETVLYATENDTQAYKQEIDPATGLQKSRTRAEDGMYQHGKFPYVFDTLFPMEGSPAGYGYIDLCSNPQTRIDLMNRAFLKNTLANATPRYFVRQDGAVNEEEFLNIENAMVHVSGTLDELSMRPIDTTNLSGNYISYMEATVNELRETSGNTETSTGSASHGVTAASALAALQEASGKTSRAATLTTYRAFEDIVYLVIELIRQFYDMPRQFRITGQMGVQRYITFQNQYMQPQWQGMMGGMDMGYRTPIYDIEVAPEKKSSYTKMAQNELAIQLYGLGFFNPQLSQQAMLCLGMMDFDGKDELMQQIQMNYMQFQQMQMMQMMAMAQGRMAGAPVNGAKQPPNSAEARNADLDKATSENSMVERSRERAQTAGQPGGSTA